MIKELAELVSKANDAQQAELHTCAPGRVIRYYEELACADIELMVTFPIIDDLGVIVFEDLPILQQVRIAFPRGGGYSITWPIAIGDSVLVMFSELDCGLWASTGSKGNPDHIRRHTLSSPFALPCIGPDTALLMPQAAADALVIAGTEDESSIWLGTKLILQIDKVVTETPLRTELDAIWDALQNHTHSGVTAGGGNTGTSNAIPSTETLGSPSVFAQKAP